MKRLILSLSMGVACVMGATMGVLAQAKPPHVTPNSPDSKSIARTLQVYLNAFNVGDLAKAYAMFADIKQHQSLKQFESQGDPQKGWRPLLTNVYVIEQDNIAEAYAKMTILPPNSTTRQNFLFVYPLIKENGTWQMVSDERDFGDKKYLLFQQINKEMNDYGQKHPINHAQSQQSPASFEDTAKALAKALNTLSHSQYVIQAGFASTPSKHLFSVSVATDTAIAPNQINPIIEHYLNEARSLDSYSQSRQFLKPFNLEVNVHFWTLGGPVWYSGTKSNGSESLTWKYDNPQPKWTPVDNVILADSNIPGGLGNTLQLVDVKGQYARNPEVGPSFGPNWTGQFQLRVVNAEGNVQSKLSLPSNKFTQPLFMGKFQFHFADYNGDGNPDFTLGQYFSSNGYVYQLFEIKPSGIVKLPTQPAILFVSDFSYSPLFQQVKPDGFRVKYYANTDNAKNKPGWYQATYLWRNGRFIQTNHRSVSSG